MNFIHSIKFRFTIWYLIVLMLLIGALSVGVYFYLSHSLHQNLDRSLEVRATQLKTIRGVMSSITMGEFEAELGEVVLLYLKNGEELTSISARNVDVTLDSALVQKALNGEALYATIKTAENRDLRFYIVPFRQEGPASLPGMQGMPPGGPSIESGAIAVGRSTTDIDESLAGLIRTLVIAGPLTLVLAGAGGIFLAQRALKPVDQITRTAHEIEESDLSRRIPVQSKDELGRLAATLNQMIERLEKAFKRQQQFTADASHELRSPLSVIQAESTLALNKERPANEYKHSLEVVSNESEHMAKVIDQLLTLARADSGKEPLSFEEIDLSELLAGVAANAEILCRDQGLEFRTELTDNILVSGDRAKLRELFLNLLDNAIRYSPDGRTISLTVRKLEERAVIAIADTGIGIPDEDIPHIFERFYRVDKARSRVESGAGLGLAISKYIAEVHGGRIEVTSKLGKGSTFIVYLPVINSK
jgi:heavy metal sensor kinase